MIFLHYELEAQPPLSNPLSASVKFKHCEERLLRNLHITYLLHALLTLLLLLKKFALTRNVTAIALRGNILTNLLDGLARYDFCTNGSLQGNIELLSRYEVTQFLAHLAAKAVGIIDVG